MMIIKFRTNLCRHQGTRWGDLKLKSNEVEEGVGRGERMGYISIPRIENFLIRETSRSPPIPLDTKNVSLKIRMEPETVNAKSTVDPIEA